MKYFYILIICISFFPTKAIFASGYKLNFNINYEKINKYIASNEKALQENNFQKVEGYYEHYKKYFTSVNQPEIPLAIHHIFKARYLAGLEQNNTKDITRLFQSAVNDVKKYKSRRLEVWCKMNYAFYYYSIHRYDLAFPLFMEVSDGIESVEPFELLSPESTFQKMGYFMGYIHEYDLAIHLINKAIQSAKNSPEKLAVFYDNLGFYYTKTEDYNKAKSAFNTALSFAIQAKNSVRRSKIYGNMGEMYFLQGNDSLAVEYLKKDIELTRQIAEQQNEVYALMLLGEVYLSAKDLEGLDGVVMSLKSLQKIAPHYFINFENRLLDLFLNWTIVRNNADEELQVRREIEKAYSRTKDTDSDEMIRQLKWNSEKKIYNTRLQLKNQKIQSNRVRTALFISVGIILFLSLIFWLVLTRKKHKEKSIRYMNLILKLRLKKQTLENKFHDSKASFETLLKEYEHQLYELKQEITKYESDKSQDHLLLTDIFQSHLITDDRWIDFKHVFQKRYPDFFQFFTTNFHELTENNLRYMILFRLGMSNEEIASLLGVSSESVRKSKQRLQKKLNDNFEVILTRPLE